MTRIKSPAPETFSALEALAAEAAKVTQAADAAMTDARENLLPTAEQKLANLEVEAVELLVAAINNGDATQDHLKKARAQIDTASGDVHWARLQLQAAELAYSRAADDEAAARRRVIAQEYLDEVIRFSDPNSRENQLIAQLENTVRELIPTLKARLSRHHTLASEVQSWPPDEVEALHRSIASEHQKSQRDTPVRPITTHGTAGMGSWMVQIPLIDVAAAIEAGIQKAGADAAAKAARAAENQ